MINELNDYCLKRPEHSLFNVVNLEACIATCHDMIECESISDFITHRKSKKLQLPLPKTMFVLSRSKALLFPELLPQVRMKMFSTFYPYFIREEECLLALGLYQFAHLKQLPEKRKCYALISQHLLANKIQSQIRLHLKNFRGSSQPVHTLFVKAETEIINMIFPLENRSTAISGPPYLWPQYLQPRWLKELVNRQQHDLECENLALDGLTFTKITSEEDSPLVDRPDSKHNLPNNLSECCNADADNGTFSRNAISMPIVSYSDNSPTELSCNSANINEPVNTAFAVDSEHIEIAGIPSSPVRNLLHFASTAVCNKVTSPLLSDSYDSEGRSPVSERSSPALHHSSLTSVGYSRLPSPNSCPLIVASPSDRKLTSRYSKIISSANGESRVACSQCSTVISPDNESADLMKNINTIKAVKFAPFKKMPSAEKSDVNKFEESVNSGQYEIEAIDETDGSIISSISSEEIVLDSSPLPSFKNPICLQQSPGITHDSNDNASSYFSTVGSEYSWFLEADRVYENTGMKYDISSCSSAVVIEKNKEVYDIIKEDDHRDCQENHSPQCINRKSFHSPCSDPETSYDMTECSSLIYKSCKNMQKLFKNI
ncbi:unnamed protein product [Onchocerca flexuosa]|uniref:FERM domain-containing protein n=1 Tax=Onchocerca flexuosa TaxID=387005 RepID=A0A183HAU7_9BILA|nr:unnamed protein product [Onchocerca flexuosa]